MEELQGFVRYIAPVLVLAMVLNWLEARGKLTWLHTWHQEPSRLDRIGGHLAEIMAIYPVAVVADLFVVALHRLVDHDTSAIIHWRHALGWSTLAIGTIHWSTQHTGEQRPGRLATWFRGVLWRGRV